MTHSHNNIHAKKPCERIDAAGLEMKTHDSCICNHLVNNCQRRRRQAFGRPPWITRPAPLRCKSQGRI